MMKLTGSGLTKVMMLKGSEEQEDAELPDGSIAGVLGKIGPSAGRPRGRLGPLLTRLWLGFRPAARGAISVVPTCSLDLSQSLRYDSSRLR